MLHREESPDGTIVHAAVKIGNSRAIEAGATTIFPVRDQPYGERSGGATDPLGNHWFMAAPLQKS